MSEADAERWSNATDLPACRWLLLTGGRLKIAGLLSLALAALAAGLVWGGLVYVGAGSTLPTVLGSGVLGALATIVTVTLSINQLVLSRVFGTPGDLQERLEDNLAFRRTVEEVADVDASPNDPGNFLALVADTLEVRAARLEQHAEDAGDGAVADFTERVVAYADRLGSARGSESTFEVLSLTFGTEYADLLDDARALERRVESDLPAAAADELGAILELLKAVAVVRQFFKTLAVQQDLARLSRWLVYTGVPALVLTFFLAQTYAPSGPTVPTRWVAVAATPIVFSPLSVLVASLLRVATVTLYTVSVGSFIPPEERVGGP